MRATSKHAQHSPPQNALEYGPPDAHTLPLKRYLSQKTVTVPHAKESGQLGGKSQPPFESINQSFGLSDSCVQTTSSINPTRQHPQSSSKISLRASAQPRISATDRPFLRVVWEGRLRRTRERRSKKVRIFLTHGNSLCEADMLQVAMVEQKL